MTKTVPVPMPKEKLQALVKSHHSRRLTLDTIEALGIEVMIKITPDQWEVGKMNATYAYGKTIREALDNYRKKYPYADV